ncbi:hypothetical protein M0804_013809, partial [Polistes exclamans]
TVDRFVKIQFFAIAKKAVLPNVAVKKSGCIVLQRIPIAKVSLAQMSS